MYPGIPEYFSPDGRGRYPYLTGSASWYLLTLLTQSYGVRGSLGDLLLHPKLVPEQFDDEGKAGVHTWFAERKLQVNFENPDRLDYGSYRIEHVKLDNDDLLEIDLSDSCRIPRQCIAALEPDRAHRITVLLSVK
jgi:cellobiose phosphorylase